MGISCALRSAVPVAVCALIREATDSPEFSSDPSDLFTQKSVAADYCWSGTECAGLLVLRNPSYLSMIQKQNLAGVGGSVTTAWALDFTWRERLPAEWLTDGISMSHPWEWRYRRAVTTSLWQTVQGAEALGACETPFASHRTIRL